MKKDSDSADSSKVKYLELIYTAINNTKATN